MALEASDQAIAAIPDTIWPYSNRAHALMFLEREDEARALYLKYRGTQNAQDDRSWEHVILGDFAGLHATGLTRPLMDEIQRALAEAAPADAQGSEPAKAAQ